MFLTNYTLKHTCGTEVGRARQNQRYLVNVSSLCVGTSHLLLHTAEATDSLYEQLGFSEQPIQAHHLWKSNQMCLRMESNSSPALILTLPSSNAGTDLLCK